MDKIQTIYLTLRLGYLICLMLFSSLCRKNKENILDEFWDQNHSAMCGFEIQQMCYVVVLRWTVWLSTVVAVCGDGLADEDLQQ